MSTEPAQTTLPAGLRLIALPTPIDEALTPTTTLKTLAVDKPQSFPCRRCLRDAQVGETVQLVSYNPFALPSADSNAESVGCKDASKDATNAPASAHIHPGPIFIHALGSDSGHTTCSPALPVEAGEPVPEQLASRELSLRAYDDGCMMVGKGLGKGEEAMELAKGLLDGTQARFVNLHFAAAGCWAARVERA